MILFVDDEPRGAKHYTVEFDEAHLDYVHKTNVDEAWEFFQEKGDQTKLLILDIMMPSGKLLENEDTDSGFSTGILFYEMIRKSKPDLPVIILTNVNEDDVIERFKDAANCSLYQKIDMPPHELVEEIKSILADGQVQPGDTQ